MRIGEIVETLERTKNESSSVLNWCDFGSSMSMDDKISIFESYYADSKVLESEDHSVMYFNGLSNFCATPQKNKQYIVVPLMLIQDRVINLNTELLELTFLEKTVSGMKFKSRDGEVTEFPGNIAGKHGLLKTFIFDSVENYNMFRSAASMKFDLELAKAHKDSLGEARKRKSKRRSSANRSPVRGYYAWGFGDSGGEEGGE
jgi:hypothetical protein